MKNAYCISIVATAAMLGLATGTPALADEPKAVKTTAEAASASGEAAGKKAQTNRNPNQRICIRETPVGSHIPRNYCKTRTEWANAGTVIVDQ